MFQTTNQGFNYPSSWLGMCHHSWGCFFFWDPQYRLWQSDNPTFFWGSINPRTNHEPMGFAHCSNGGSCFVMLYRSLSRRIKNGEVNSWVSKPGKDRAKKRHPTNNAKALKKICSSRIDMMMHGKIMENISETIELSGMSPWTSEKTTPLRPRDYPLVIHGHGQSSFYKS